MTSIIYEINGGKKCHKRYSKVFPNNELLVINIINGRALSLALSDNLLLLVSFSFLSVPEGEYFILNNNNVIGKLLFFPLYLIIIISIYFSACLENDFESRDC